MPSLIRASDVSCRDYRSDQVFSLLEHFQGYIETCENLVIRNSWLNDSSALVVRDNAEIHPSCLWHTSFAAGCLSANVDKTDSIFGWLTLTVKIITSKTGSCSEEQWFLVTMSTRASNWAWNSRVMSMENWSYDNQSESCTSWPGPGRVHVAPGEGRTSLGEGASVFLGDT